jgi:hypothetical protein
MAFVDCVGTRVVKVQQEKRSWPTKSQVSVFRMLYSGMICLAAVSPSAAQDTPANIISDQIRRQGFACEEPRHAERDEQASRPNGAVWTLSCGNAKYRVTLIPDMAANVELIK